MKYDFDTIDKRLMIFANLFRVANRLQTTLDTKMDDMTGKQWFVILMLGMFDYPPTLGELAEMCDSSHQNTKQLVLKLESRGFVTAEKDSNDGRAIRISATDKCDMWAQDNEEISGKFIDAMFSGLSHEDLDKVSGALFKIYDNLWDLKNET